VSGMFTLLCYRRVFLPSVRSQTLNSVSLRLSNDVLIQLKRDSWINVS
jgi:hypothetical protein